MWILSGCPYQLEDSSFYFSFVECFSNERATAIFVQTLPILQRHSEESLNYKSYQFISLFKNAQKLPRVIGIKPKAHKIIHDLGLLLSYPISLSLLPCALATFTFSSHCLCACSSLYLRFLDTALSAW